MSWLIKVVVTKVVSGYVIRKLSQKLRGTSRH